MVVRSMRVAVVGKTVQVMISPVKQRDLNKTKQIILMTSGILMLFGINFVYGQGAKIRSK